MPDMVHSVVLRAEDPKHTLTYWVDFNDTKNPTLWHTMKVENWNISAWNETDGTQGMRMALGWNTDDMD